jgi:hypothetical protein
MAYAQKPDFVFWRNGLVHLNRRGRQFIRLLAAEVSVSAVVMLDTPCSEVVWRYWLPTPFASFPFTSPPLRHRVPSHFNWTLPSTPPLYHHGADRRGFTFYVLLDLLNDAITSSECIASDSWMSIELGRMCKEAAVRWFEVHSQRLPGWTEERHKIPLKKTGLLVEIWNRYPQTESKNLPTGFRSSVTDRSTNVTEIMQLTLRTLGLEKPIVIQMLL